jgi:CHAD domain-containing protein
MAGNKIQWDPENGPAENAKQQLPKLAKDYFAEVRTVLAANPAPADLHQLRLASKRFRYTLELFRPCYAAGLKERIEKLKELQDILGDCNDAVVTAAAVNKLFRRRTAERERVRKELEKLAEKKAAAFRAKWKKEFDTPDAENWWTGYLARSARPPVKG